MRKVVIEQEDEFRVGIVKNVSMKSLEEAVKQLA